MQKNIAFFTSDWNYQLVNRFLEGMEQFLELNPDVKNLVYMEVKIRRTVKMNSFIYRI